MLINADFSRRAVVASDQYHWVSSPEKGVERVMLDRVGEEKARATSIVRYAPSSTFPPHSHPNGEEILVLSGTFSDDSGHYPAGWYLRNPPGSSHRPFSDEGAVIFVKLRQMPVDENRLVRVDTRNPDSWTVRDGCKCCPLYVSEAERVAIECVPARGRILRQEVGGAEMLVLAGLVREGSQQYERGSWIRLPPGRYPDFTAGEKGATVYLKTGHLSGRVPC